MSGRRGYNRWEELFFWVIWTCRVEEIMEFIHKKRIYMTKLDFLNRYILQWFFLRLCRHEDTIREVKAFKLMEASVYSSGIGCNITDYEIVTITWYSLMLFPFPLSGYGRDEFRCIGGKEMHMRLTKDKKTRWSPPPENFNCRCSIIPPK